MIEVAVSERTALPPWPRAGVPEYLFSVRSWGGPSPGNGVHEFDWTLEVDSRRGLVSVESFRSDDDESGQPLGVFRRLMSDEELRGFRDTLTRARLGDARRPWKVHPAYTQRIYRLQQPGTPEISLLINNAEHASNEEIVELRHAIMHLLSDCLEHPERSVRLDFALADEGFVVTITNHGIEKVCFTDPRWIVPEGRMRQAVVRMTELPVEKPGSPPPSLAWMDSALAPLERRPIEEPLVTMAPGATLRLRAPLVGRDRRKRYVAYFSWASSGGEAMVNGAYRIRGKADSNRLVMEGEEG